MWAIGILMGLAVPHDAETTPVPLTIDPEEILKNDVGSWSATLRTVNAQTGEAEESLGTEVNKWGPGKTSLITDFTGTFMGQPFKGHGVLGFDHNGKLVSSWVDNRTPVLRVLVGEVNEGGTGRVLTGDVQFDGKLFRERQTVTWESRSRRRFTIETQGADGAWTVALEVTYQRRG
jgi:hypothetical protein